MPHTPREMEEERDRKVRESSEYKVAVNRIDEALIEGQNTFDLGLFEGPNGLLSVIQKDYRKSGWKGTRVVTSPRPGDAGYLLVEEAHAEDD